jgi:hypothetical protein
MNSKRPLLVALLASTLLIAGCSTAHLTKQADANDRAAQIADDAATDLNGILTKYPAGTIEDGQLATLVRSVLPEAQEAHFDRLLSIGGDVRESAELLASELPDLAETFRAEAASLRASALEDDTKWNNTLDSITSAAKSFGGIAGIIGGIAGVWFRRKQTQAEAVTEDIVSAIHASPVMRAAIDGEGGSQVRAAMPTGTQKVVKKIKASI